MKKILILLNLCLFFGLVNEVKAQDPTFSQFFANPLYLNPAMAGTNICPRISLNHRNQWPGIGKTYVTYSASYDQYENFEERGNQFKKIVLKYARKNF